MPLYDYDCGACGRRFEAIHGVHADGPAICPLCGGGPVRKAIAAPAVHFKGSGWAKKERRVTKSAGTSTATSEETAPTGGESAEVSPAKTGTATEAGSVAPSSD